MFEVFVVGLGGAVGSMARYAVSGAALRLWGTFFPFGTLIVNIAGSLLIGFICGLFERISAGFTVRLFLVTGVLGGFTTFSAFGFETFYLLRNGQYKLAVLNSLGSVILGVSAVFLGYWISKVR